MKITKKGEEAEMPLLYSDKIEVLIMNKELLDEWKQTYWQGANLVLSIFDLTLRETETEIQITHWGQVVERVAIDEDVNWRLEQRIQYALENRIVERFKVSAGCNHDINALYHLLNIKDDEEEEE